MTKSVYWLIGPGNTFAVVEGADLRDEATGQGWIATGEPTFGDRVWMRHNVTRRYAELPYGALDAWQAIGWEYAVPPTQPGEQGLVVVLPDPGVPGPATSVEPAVTPPPADEAHNKEKETRRGR